MAQIYVSHRSPSSPSSPPPSALPSPHKSAFHGGPILQFLNSLHSKLPTFESTLNETAIEKELYATENETPSMDLLTCSSALTNGSAGSNSSSSSNLKRGVHHHHPTLSKVESASGLQWSCTGKYNPSLGLGPLADLFSGVLAVRTEEVVDAAATAADNFTGQLKHSFLLHGYEQQHQHTVTQLDQGTNLHSRTPEPVYSCHSFSRDYGVSLPMPSSATATSYDATDNYSYGYSQADFGTDQNGYQQLTTPFALTSTTQQLYSTATPEEWYSIPPGTIVDGGIAKYSDNMMDVRLNGYSNDYPSLNQASAGHYY